MKIQYRAVDVSGTEASPHPAEKYFDFVATVAGAIDPAQVWGAARLRISSHSGFFCPGFCIQRALLPVIRMLLYYRIAGVYASVFRKNSAARKGRAEWLT